MTELAAPFDMSQQAVSKHLAYLERARLISKRREGRLHFCSLDPKALDGVESWINDCRRLWEQRLDRLDLVLKDMKQEANRND